MDVSKLKRDASVKSQIIQVLDNALIAKKPLQIHIPFRYQAAKLASVGKEFYTVGIFAIVYEGVYMVSNVTSLIQLTPDSIYSEKINNEEYYVLHFEAGSVIAPRLDLVVDDDIAYKVYDELIGKAKIPWFCNYEDVSKCMADVHYYSKLKLSSSNAVFELLVASIARDRNDTQKYYRETIDKIEEQETNPPVILPFRSVIVGTTNTMGKLIGSYFDEGLVSALTYEGGPAGVENLLRL